MTALPPPCTLRYVDARPGVVPLPVQWGVPWPRGTVQDLGELHLEGDDGERAVDSWVTARWPDGSVKWSGHAALADGSAAPTLRSGAARTADAARVTVTADGDRLAVDTGALRLEVVPHPEAPLRRLEVAGREVGAAGRLVASSTGGSGDAPRRHAVRTTAVAVERAGDVQAVLRLEGHHEVETEDGTETVFPFVLRLTATAGSTRLRAVHTLVWDADPERFRLASLGLRIDVPLQAETHDRHVRLAGGGGMLAEAVRGVTGLRRDPGEAVRAAQVAGRSTPPLEEWAPEVSGRLHRVPAWDAWTLRQPTENGYTISKRTAEDRPWVRASGGRRSRGYAYVGDTAGGIGVGLRDFWKLVPTQLDVTGARGDRAAVTAWMYAPTAEPMDLRFYHDGMGQDTYADQLDALEITYEDYEPGYGDARGIARTHELVIDAFAATPTTSELDGLAAACALPPQLLPTPETLHAARVLGTWAPVDRSTPERAHLEDRLVFLREFYRDQVEQRGWYGFWDYGDVMHTYDADRHTWRYDVGGYAWDNSELSPDLWLWTDALRSGDADAYRLAEAMTRHTGEVDQYHLGPFRGLGTRHNVQHFGCSAKQLRVSSALYRRHLYYLTADERLGELLDEVAASEEALLRVDATRKVREDVYAPDRSALAIGLGTDLGALLGAWLTAWERHQDPQAERKLRSALAGIGQLPQGLFTGEALWDLDEARFDTSRDRIQVSHLAAVFGLAEIVAELRELIPDEGFERAWAEYCRYYLADAAEQAERFGAPLQGISLIPAYSRLLAVRAAETADPALADRAWEAFLWGRGDQVNTDSMVGRRTWARTRLDGPEVPEPVDEAAFVGTNGAAQYGLSAIANLALIGDDLPRSLELPGEAP